MELIKNQTYIITNKYGVETTVIYQGMNKNEFEFIIENGFCGGKVKFKNLDEFEIRLK